MRHLDAGWLSLHGQFLNEIQQAPGLNDAVERRSAVERRQADALTVVLHDGLMKDARITHVEIPSKPDSCAQERMPPTGSGSSHGE